jgi:tetratricopeptide (TPR) repeat protein
MDKTSDKYWVCRIYLVLALTTLAAYWQVRNCDFVNFDDQTYVTANKYVNTGISWENVRWAFTAGKLGYWHPLTWLSHMLDCRLFGLRPGWHHLSNLLLHVANTLLLFGLFKRMTGAVWRSAFVAAVFALHPVNVESVAWVAERKNVLSTLFWFLTLWGYASYVRRGGAWRYLVTLLLFVLGLLSKPMLVTLPFVMLVLDYWPLGRLGFGGEGRRVKGGEWTAQIFGLVREKVPFFVLSGVSVYLSFLSVRHLWTRITTDLVPMKLRIGQALVSYVSYIGKIILPRGLAVYYPYPESVPLWQSVAALLSLVFATLVLIWVLRRRRYLAAGWLWYVGTLMPVIGLIQSGLWPATADRWLYVPLTGILIMVAWGAAELVGKWRYGRTALGISAAVVLGCLFICTRIQVTYWEGSLRLCGHALEVTENNAVMHSNYATALHDEGRYEEALAHFNEALRINPDYFDARRNIGNLYLKQGKYNEAIANLSKLLQMGKEQAKVHRSLGLAYGQLGEEGLAIQHYNQALRLDPEDLKVRLSLGRLLLAHGRFREAIACFNEVLRTKTDMPDVYSNLGLAYCQLGDYDLAVKHWTEAVKLKPDFAGVLNNLAWILGVTEDTNLRNPAGAVEYAERACELTEYNRPDFLDTLAIAYAAVGNFPEAVKTAEKAVALALSLERKDLAAEIQKRLELYKVGTAYYE